MHNTYVFIQYIKWLSTYYKLEPNTRNDNEAHNEYHTKKEE